MIYAPVVEETVISFETEVPSVAEMRDRIAGVSPTWPWLVADDAGRVVGYAYASRHRERGAYRWAVDVSAYVAPDARGAGIGRTLYQALIRILRLQGFYRAYAGIALPNDASVGLHRSVGFELVGIYRRVGFKLGRWNDVAWYGLTLHDDVATPTDPTPLSALPGHELAAAIDGD